MNKGIFAVAAGALATLAGRGAAADKPFVDRSLTLSSLHLSGDAGLGFGQHVTTTLPPGGPGKSSTKIGWGSNLEAAVGLPFLGELGVRFGFRFGDDGILAGADHFARLFDPIVNEPGGDSMANPELRLRSTLLDLQVFEIGLETRAIIPTAGNSDFALTPGAPVRIHVPTIARIDTGIWVPIETNADTSYAIDIPAQLFFQAGDAFFGPLTGVRFNHPGGAAGSSVDIPVGVGGGYTLGGFVDVKVQIRTERINDANWSQFLGGGVGVGIRVP